MQLEDLNKCLGFSNYSFDKFMHMCILSGCDYLPSINGIGLHRAKIIVQAAEKEGIEWAITNLKDILKRPSLVIPENYWKNFMEAKNAFLHQSVFDPSTSTAVPLNETSNNQKCSLYPIHN